MKRIRLYRQRRGSLADSMATIQVVTSFDYLVELLRDQRDGWMNQKDVSPATVVVERYFYDERTGWDTHVVKINGVVVGYTNGPLYDI